MNHTVYKMHIVLYISMYLQNTHTYIKSIRYKRNQLLSGPKVLYILYYIHICVFYILFYIYILCDYMSTYHRYWTHQAHP